MLNVNRITEVEMTMAEAMEAGVFCNSNEWQDRSVKDPLDKVFVYTHPVAKRDEYGIVHEEFLDSGDRYVCFYVQGERAIFCSVVDILKQYVCDLDQWAPRIAG